MYDERIEQLIKAALADGVLTEKEKQILFKRAQEQGIDLDEFEMVLDARLVELQKAEKENAEKSAPKSTKFGDVRKCPACGALVPAMAVSCAECGFEFTGLEASSSAQTLAKEISKIGNFSGKNEKVKELIKNFPVPNAKHDLFDLIVFLKQHVEDEVYEQKLQECLDRAKYLFPSDPLLAKVMEDAKRATKAKGFKNVSEVIAGIGTAVGLIVSVAVYVFLGIEFEWGFWEWFGYLYATSIVGMGVAVGLGALLKALYLKANKKYFQ